MSTPDQLLVREIRQGESTAWARLIERYEGRLAAFVETRVRDRAASEDIVQETFVGFLTSLPHFDERRGLETYLFSIAAHKLTDHLRRQGRRPAAREADAGSRSPGLDDVVSPERRASSLARSREREQIEAKVLGAALVALVEQWTSRGEWERLKCIELLFVRGRANKEAAAALGISEQTVANYKYQAIQRLRELVGERGGGSRAVASGRKAPSEPADEQDERGIGLPASATDGDLVGYLDEGLPAEEMVRVEQGLRQSAALRRQLERIQQDREAGLGSVASVWRGARASCPARGEWGSFLLETLPEGRREYLEFHVRVVGCRYCQANLSDLRRAQEEPVAQASQRRQRFFQSSAGLLSRR